MRRGTKLQYDTTFCYRYAPDSVDPSTVDTVQEQLYKQQAARRKQQFKLELGIRLLCHLFYW